jgi:hypothetical protein
MSGPFASLVRRFKKKPIEGPAPKPVPSPAEIQARIRNAERLRVSSIMAMDAPLDQLSYLAYKTNRTVAEVEDLLDRTRAMITKQAEDDKALRAETVRLATRGNERSHGKGA